MKNTVSASLLLLFTIQNIWAEEKTDPSDLVSLRNSWQGAIERSTDSINKTYLDELTKLKSRYAGEGKSKDAIAVQNEIELLAIQFDSKRRFQRFSGKWKWSDNNEIFVINPDGTGKHNIHGRFTITKADDSLIEVAFPESPYAPLPYLFRWISEDRIERIRLNAETNETMTERLGMMRMDD